MQCPNCKTEAENQVTKYYCPKCKVYFTKEMTAEYVKAVAKVKRESRWK